MLESLKGGTNMVYPFFYMTDVSNTLRIDGAHDS